MKIAILSGSPHKKGSTALLADEFTRGAEEAGHEVWRLDAARADIRPCLGCNACQAGKRPCVVKDDMQEVFPKLLEADVVAFVSPLHFHGYTSQLKAVLDRFHAIEDPLKGMDKDAVLIVAGANPREWVTGGVEATYECNLKYLGWRDRGRVLAIGCWGREAVEKSDYPGQAYQLGLGL